MCGGFKFALLVRLYCSALLFASWFALSLLEKFIFLLVLNSYIRGEYRGMLSGINCSSVLINLEGLVLDFKIACEPVELLRTCSLWPVSLVFIRFWFKR